MPARIVYSGDESAAQQYLPAAQNLLHKTRVQATTTGAGVTGLSLFLAEGVYTYTLKAGDIEVIFIHADRASSEETAPRRALPDFISGVTRNARLVEEKAVISGEDKVRTVLKDYKPTAETAKLNDWPRGWQSSPRLGVKIAPSVRLSGGSDAQLGVLVPSMYSGRMRKLVQVLLGYGKLDEPPADEGAEDEVGVLYDCRWHRTHLLSKGADGRLWLVEISITNGVIAMLLPTFEGSDVLKDSEQASIAEAAKEFDGLPTGESFLTGDKLTAAIRKGEVVRLLSRQNLEEFYRLQAFSSVHGWTTNTAGDSAYNIGWYFGTDGYRRSRLYELTIKIGAVRRDRVEGQPLAVASAQLRRMESARYYHPSARQPPPLKFHEPLAEGLLSVEFLATVPTGDDGSGEPDIDVGPPTEFDAPMFVSYIGDQLNLVRYHWITQARAREVRTNDGPCRFNGTVTTTFIDYGLALPTFYCSGRGGRSEYVPTITQIVKSGKFLFVSNRFSLIQDRSQLLQWYSQWRMHVFKIQTEHKITGAPYSRIVVIVPEGLRDGYVVAEVKSSGTVTLNNSTGYLELLNPHAYNTFSYIYPGEARKDQCWEQWTRRMREAYSVTDGGTEVYITEDGGTASYRLSECADMVDGGQWLTDCQKAPDVSGPATPLPVSEPQKVSPAVFNVVPTMVLDCNGSTSIALTESNKAELWTIRSPDPDYSQVQRMSARFCAFGTAHNAYHDEPDGELVANGPLLNGESGGSRREYNFLGVL